MEFDLFDLPEPAEFLLKVLWYYISLISVQYTSNRLYNVTDNNDQYWSILINSANIKGYSLWVQEIPESPSLLWSLEERPNPETTETQNLITSTVIDTWPIIFCNPTSHPVLTGVEPWRILCSFSQMFYRFHLTAELTGSPWTPQMPFKPRGPWKTDRTQH